MRGFDLTGYKKIFNLATLAAAALLWIPPLLVYPQSLQSRSSDAGLLGLSGAVKELTEKQASFKERGDRWGEQQQQLFQSITFDAHGRKTREILYSEGSSAEQTDYIYDGGGRLKEIRTAEPGATTVQRFDESGEKLEETKRFGSAGGIRESWKRTREAGRTNMEYKSYYNDGRLERREGTILNGAGMVTEKRFEPSHGGQRRWEYEYDATGKLIEGRFYEESKYGPEVWSSSYDGRGILTEVRHANTTGRLISRRSYSYEGIFSESGTSRSGGGSRSNIVMNRQAAEWYNQDGAVEFSWTYMYDARGNLIEKLYRHPEPSFEIKWAYTNNQKNERTSEVYYDSRGSVFSGYRTTNEYDSKGRVIATIQHDASGTRLSSSRFEYNNRGDLTESITYNPDDSLASSTIYEYQYDTKGNWVVKKTLYTNNLREEYGVPTLVQYRTIEYFD